MSITISEPYVNYKHKVDVFTFPGGEVNVTINLDKVPLNPNHLFINARVANSNDFIATLLTTDAVRREFGNIKITLFIPYFPYARQDRACNSGEALSVAVIAKMINAMDFHEVIIVDPHSDVTPALINNCIVWDQTVILDLFEKYREDWNLYRKLCNKELTLVSPDAGAEKKILQVAKHFNGLDIIHASKVRDTSTGRITATKIDDSWNHFDSMAGMDLLIVDDICDGGMTFIKLAEELQNFSPNSINLYVTHGIFSKGYAPLFEAGISRIFTTNSFEQTYEVSGLRVVSL